MLVRGTDSDNYDGEVPTRHFVKLRDEAAVRFNILGLEVGQPFAHQQRQASHEAGLIVPFAYKFLYWVPSDLENMRQACRLQLPIAIDCEYETNWSPSRVLDRIGEAKRLLQQEGLYWGIYTGPWWWVPKTGDSQDYRNDRWWHASYPFNRPGGAAVLPPMSFLPTSLYFSSSLATGINVTGYGGKGHADVWQYANTCYFDDEGDWDFDLNCADDSLWTTFPPPPVDVNEELRRLIGVGDTIQGDIELTTTTGYKLPLHFDGTIRRPE